MISVLYSFEDDRYTYLSVKGHAFSADPGKDLVCAGVSTVLFGLMNALDESGENVEIFEKNSRIEILNHSISDKVNDYLSLALYQLKTVEESYGDFIKVERK